MKKLAQILLIMICSLAIVQSSSAISISPGRYEVAYEPGTQHEFTFQVGNAGYVSISKRGEMIDYLELEEGVYDLSAGATREITVKFTVPPNLTSGIHNAEILAAELPSQSTGTMNAVAAVVGQIRITIPYPEKYAELFSVDAEDVAVGQKVYFVAKLRNYGEQEIQSAAGALEIRNYLTNKSITTIPLTTVQNIKSLEEASLSAEWDTTGAAVGNYIALAAVQYDDIIANPRASLFKVGDKFVQILDVRAASVPAGSMAKIAVDAQSIWPEPLSTFARAIISANQTTLGDVKSPTEVISPWGRTQFTLYWDTNKISAGTYDLKVILHYDDKTTENNTQIIVTEAEAKQATEKTISLPPEQLIILTLVVLIIVFGILFARKRRGRSKPQTYAYAQPYRRYG